jgi:hypothetical protein
VILCGLVIAGCYQSHAAPAGGRPIPEGGVDVPWDVEPPPGHCPPGYVCRLVELPDFRGVDILVVVDNSMSMAEEQATLAAQFPVLIEAILEPPSDAHTGIPLHVPITDLHVGVVSTDMGTGGYSVETCRDPIDGNDGILMHATSPEIEGCDPLYPTFLEYDEVAPEADSIDWMSLSFGCIGVLGIDGCGFEQPLEAALKALTVHAAPGRPNAGFLRDDSVLMVLWLADEDDCSVLHPEIFDTRDSSLGHLNLRCFHYPFMAHPVERYVDGLWDLRRDSIWPLLLGMIVGVPTGDAGCNGFADEIDDCLDDPRMLEGVDPVSMTRLVPSCTSTAGEAYPPRRLVEVAQAYGHYAYVHSICESDYTPVLLVLADLVNAIADFTCAGTIVELLPDPEEACTCRTSCRLVHVLPDDGPCPGGTTRWDPERDGSPAHLTDRAGNPVSSCEVPYAGTSLGLCELGCHDFRQVYSPVEEGWYYTIADTGVACPSVGLTPGFETPAGGFSFVACP